MKFQKKLFQIVSIIFALLIIAVVLIFIYRDTGNPISIALFKFGYSVTPSKHSYLHFYSPLRRDVSAGYLPVEVDEFLCGNLETTQSPDEFAAIVHLYSIQAGGREGSCVYLTSDVTREKIAGLLVDGLDVEGIDLYRKIVLLEEIRRGEGLGKGQIAPSSTETEKPSSKEQWKSWIEGTALPIAKARYGEWWRSNLSWAEKKSINPLEGTRVGVYECCG